MASNVDTSGYQEGRYFARAWALLTHEKGWWKPVLICMVASLVPIVGPMAVLGYLVEWSRRIAWGGIEGPSRRVKVGDLLRSGWRAFVVIGGWGIASWIVTSVIGMVSSGFVYEVLSFVWTVISVFLSMVFMVAAVRATIYQSFVAGYRMPTLWKMATEDPVGLVRIWFIKVVSYVIDFVVALAIAAATFFSSFGWIYRFVQYVEEYSSFYAQYYGSSFSAEVIGALVVRFWPALLLIFVLVMVIGVFAKFLVYAALGLWLRRFDVPRWGRDEDPLPERMIAEKAQLEAPVPPSEPAQAAPVRQPSPVQQEMPAQAARPVQQPSPVQTTAPAQPAAPVAQEESVQAAPAARAQQSAPMQASVQPVAPAETAVSPAPTQVPQAVALSQPAEPSESVTAPEASAPAATVEPSSVVTPSAAESVDPLAQVVSVEPIAVAPIEAPESAATDATSDDAPSA